MWKSSQVVATAADLSSSHRAKRTAYRAPAKWTTLDELEGTIAPIGPLVVRPCATSDARGPTADGERAPRLYARTRVVVLYASYLLGAPELFRAGSVQQLWRGGGVPKMTRW